MKILVTGGAVFTPHQPINHKIILFFNSFNLINN